MSYYISIGLRHVRVWIGILECLLAWVEWPSRNVDLFAQRGRIRLHERVHVFPAVEVADAADLGLRDRFGSVTGAIPEDQTLDVSGANLPSMVEDIACGRNENLRRVQAG